MIHSDAFLKQAYRYVVASEEDGDDWVQEQIEAHAVEDRDLALSLRAALEQGATKQEIVDLARCIQASALFSLCSLVWGNCKNTPVSARWGLYSLDEGKQPTEHLAALHESVLSMDPTGREMRPRPELLDQK